jgi:xylulokinase
MRGALEGQWVSLSYMSAGSLLAWVAQLLWGNEEGEAPDLDELARVAARADSGADGLIFLPHVDGRLLPSQPRMRGAWIGLSRHHRQPHMVRSVLEGVAYEYAAYLRVLAELHDDLDLREVRVVGGGARSDVWNQIKADVLGVSYVRPRRSEFSCWGAALVAGKAVGLLEDLGAAAAGATEVERRFEPDASAHELHREQAQVYARLMGVVDPAAVDRALARQPELP